jgi:hypothetical protein
VAVLVAEHHDVGKFDHSVDHSVTSGTSRHFFSKPFSERSDATLVANLLLPESKRTTGLL